MNEKQFGEFLLRLGGLYSAEGCGVWLYNEHKDLDKSPADLIAEGRFDEVDAALERLETGAFS